MRSCSNIEWKYKNEKQQRAKYLNRFFRSQVAHPLTISLLLSCPQIVTARIMTSRVHCFVGGLSKKKQTLTTVTISSRLWLWILLFNMFFIFLFFIIAWFYTTYIFSELKVQLIFKTFQDKICSDQFSCILFCSFKHTNYPNLNWLIWNLLSALTRLIHV